MAKGITNASARRRIRLEDAENEKRLYAASYSVSQNGSYTGLSLTTANFNPSTNDPTADWTITVPTGGASYTASVFNNNFGATAAAAGVTHVWNFSSLTGITQHG